MEQSRAELTRPGMIRFRDITVLAMIPPFTKEGLLPRGRFVATIDEVEESFVKADHFRGSATRQQVWDDFLALVELLRRKRARMPAAFLGGSFTSDVLDPSDVDTSVLIDQTRISSPKTWDDLAKIARGAKPAGLKLDAFLINWRPEGDQSPESLAYHRSRGMWDDWWQRHVPKPDRLPPLRHHAMPLRGYLEVIVDGYK
jgi:hypothetical protein